MFLGAFYHTILAILFAVVAVLLMLVILLQRGKGVGLSGAFGGAGGGSTAFGAKTGDVLTWVTVAGAVLLLTFTVALNYVFQPTGPGLQPIEAQVAPTVPEETSPAPATGEPVMPSTPAAEQGVPGGEPAVPPNPAPSPSAPPPGETEGESGAAGAFFGDLC